MHPYARKEFVELSRCVVRKVINVLGNLENVLNKMQHQDKRGIFL